MSRVKKLGKNLLFLVVVIIAIIFLILKFMPEEPTVEREVSDRAKEYLAKDPVEKKIPQF